MTTADSLTLASRDRLNHLTHRHDYLTAQELRAVLTRIGYEVRDVPNSRLWQGGCRTTPADLVTPDLCVLEMKWREFILELTQKCLNPKVIAVSGALNRARALSMVTLLLERYGRPSRSLLVGRWIVEGGEL